MAADGKVDLTIDMEVDPWQEVRGKKAPLWLAARPKVAAKIKPIPVKSKLEVDPRKWKKKVIEDGVRGVARYELALFSTILGEQAKKLTKEIPEKDHKALKPGDKGLQKPQITALDEAAAKAEAAWKKIAVKIADKVSIALEEIASDKGDNTKALAAGKSAIRKFDQLDTSKMFTDPTKGTVVALVALGDALKKNAEDPKAWAAAHTALTKVDSDFEKTGKTARNVVKYLKDQGPKIAKDKGAAPELRKVGDLINSNAVKPHLTSLDQAVMRFENALEAEIAFLKAEKGNGDQVKNRARAFGNDNKDKDKDLKAAVAAVKKVSKAFSDASKAVK